jgi:DNA-directed RNA polymerase specialized sigma24 family protein
MTPTEEATFIALWTQGASYRDISQALGCALGTVGSRVATLVAQGKIVPRPGNAADRPMTGSLL